MKRAINLFGEDDRYTVDLSVFLIKIFIILVMTIIITIL